MPSSRTTALAVPLSSAITGRRTAEKIRRTGADQRASGIGIDSAAFLGTSSPKSTVKRVAKISATAVAMPSATGADTPTDCKLGSIRWATAGRAR